MKAGLAVDPESITTLTPPQPDISCRIDGVLHYVELTRMVHADFANLLGHHLSELDRTGGADALPMVWYDDRGALRATIERKKLKAYQDDGLPVVLLIYIDGVFHPPGMFSEHAQMVLENEGLGARWSEIWVYDSFRGCIVAHWSNQTWTALTRR